MAGGCITTAGFVLSTFSPNFEVFVLVFGVITGAGIGMMFLPSTVMVGYYFETRRALATGIAYAGAGVGMLLMAPFAAFLVQTYDWRNALRLLSCVSLQGVVMGALYRPLDLPCCRESLLTKGLERPDPDTTIQVSSERPTRYIEHRRKNSETSSHHVQGNQKSYNNSIELIAEKDETHEVKLKVEAQRSFHKESKETENTGCDGSTKLPHRKGDINIKNVLLNPMSRKDIYYSSSIIDLAEFKSKPNMKSYITSIISYDARISEIKGWRSRVNCTHICPDFSLLVNPFFLIIAWGSVFIQLGYFIPFVYLSEFALSFGIPASTASLTMSVFGLSTSIGRVTSGALATLKGVNALHLNNISLMVAGIASIVAVYACSTVLSFSVYAMVYGFYIGHFVPLVTVFLVEYLGLENLSHSFGLLALFRGISSFVGPPVAGYLIDQTGSTSSAFMFAGAVLVTAGCVHYLLPIAKLSSRPLGR